MMNPKDCLHYKLPLYWLERFFRNGERSFPMFWAPNRRYKNLNFWPGTPSRVKSTREKKLNEEHDLPDSEPHAQCWVYQALWLLRQLQSGSHVDPQKT
jgi:hypothetical protein